MSIFSKLFWSLIDGRDLTAEPTAPPEAKQNDDGAITASNYLEAARFRDGITPEGDVYKTLTRTGHNTWKAGTEKFK